MNKEFSSCCFIYFQITRSSINDNFPEMYRLSVELSEGLVKERMGHYDAIDKRWGFVQKASMFLLVVSALDYWLLVI